MNITIFGSCVSRDIFRGDFYNGKDNITIDKYFARTSLISLNSLPLNIDVSGVEDLDPFQRRLLSDDLQKTFYSYLKKTKDSSVLLIDFLDERFHLYQWENNYLTRSNEFLKARISDKVPGKIVKRFTQSTTNLWKENCLLFIKIIRQSCKDENIILHKAFWKEEYIDGQDVFRFPNIQEIKQQNKMLNEYYDYFEKNCPGLTVLDVNGNRTYRADKNHIWGLGEMHYEQDYYTACMEFLAGMAQ
jgi:hypothetical protein